MKTLDDADLTRLLAEAGDSHPLPEGGADRALEALRDLPAPVPLAARRRAQLTAAAALVAVATLAGVTVFGGNDVDRVGQLAGAAPASSRPVAAPPPTEAANKNGAVDDLVKTSAEATTGDRAAADRELSLESGRAPYAARSGTLDTRTGPVGAELRSQAAPAPAAAGPVPVDGARVVKKGAIALVVDDGEVSSTLTRVQGFATAVGGLVSAATTEESGATPSGRVVLRVPVARFEGVVQRVRTSGADVRSATTSGQDVTAQYADTQAQLRTLRAARERFLLLLTRADTIGDVLSVQQRVDDVTGRIDRLEGQRRVLAAQSDTATLEVTVTERDDPAVVATRPDTGLSKAFTDARTGFTSGVEALVRLSGRGLLLLLCVAAAALLLRVGVRGYRRRLV